MKKPTPPPRRPWADHLIPNIPPMPLHISADDPPFLRRVYTLVNQWVQTEWIMAQQIQQDIDNAKNSPIRKQLMPLLNNALKDTKLNTANLARRLDNMSASALHKELSAYGAPTPGAIIRRARLSYAKHLLAYMRCPITEIVARAGYRDHDHFTERFKAVLGMTPSAFRRGVRDARIRNFNRNYRKSRKGKKIPK